MRRRNPTHCGACGVWVTCLTQHNKRLKHIAAVARWDAANLCKCSTHGINNLNVDKVSPPSIVNAP